MAHFLKSLHIRKCMDFTLELEINFTGYSYPDLKLIISLTFENIAPLSVAPIAAAENSGVNLIHIPL